MKESIMKQAATKRIIMMILGKILFVEWNCYQGFLFFSNHKMKSSVNFGAHFDD